MEARRVVGYVRVSTSERRATRPSRTDQRRALTEACAARGWGLIGVQEDLRSGRSLRRPGLGAAIETCRAGLADAVVVVRLDRLTTSLEDVGELLRRARAGSFAIVSLDLGLDSSTESGAMVTDVLAAAAAWHPVGVGWPAGQRATSQPTEHRGRPTSTPPEVAERIRALRGEGRTLQAICDLLNDEGVSTPRGGTHWRPTSLRSILKPRPRSAAATTHAASAADSTKIGVTR